MATIGSRQAREQFAELLNRAAYAGERIVISRRGKPVAALIPADDLALLEQLEDAEDIAAVREADATDDGTRIPLTDLKQELGL
jgi:prevent-host-death family protein